MPKPYKKQQPLGSSKAPTLREFVQKLMPNDLLNHERVKDEARRKLVIARLEQEVARSTPIERIITSLANLARTGEKSDLVNASNAFIHLVELLKRRKEPEYKIKLAGSAMGEIADLLDAQGMIGKANLLKAAAENAQNWEKPA